MYVYQYIHIYTYAHTFTHNYKTYKTPHTSQAPTHIYKHFHMTLTLYNLYNLSITYI